MTTQQIANELNISEATVSYHKAKLGVSKSRSTDVDWEAVSRDLRNGATQMEVRKRHKIGAPRFTKAVANGLIPDLTTKRAIPLDEVLVENSTYQRVHLKRRLLEQGLLENTCALCPQGPEWNGKPLVLALDHENGISNDNRLSNLRLLCPNCHSQTETFAGRNTRRKP